MGYFKFRWLHRIIRRRMNPISHEKALSMKEKLSLLYMFIGWNCLGLVAYMCFTGKKDWADYYGLKSDEEKNIRPSVFYAQLLGIQRAKVITYTGFKKVDEIEYDATLEENAAEESSASA